MSDETRLKQRMREYVAGEPASRLTFESVVTAGRRSRRRRRVAGASYLMVGTLVAGSFGAYAIGGPDMIDRQAPVVETPTAKVDQPGNQRWTIEEILERPLTAEERRIGERIKANMEAALLPASAEVSFRRMDQLSTTGRFDESGELHGRPESPYVEFYVTVETDQDHTFYFTSWSRSPVHVDSPDLSLCEDPDVYCADTEAGQVVALDGTGEYAPEGTTADGELGAVVYGPDTGLMTLAFSQGARSWEPDPDTLDLFTTEQLGQIVSDPDLWMRDGTEGIDPRATWTAPPEDPGTPDEIADLQQEIRQALADGIQDRLDAGEADPGEISAAEARTADHIPMTRSRSTSRSTLISRPRSPGPSPAARRLPPTRRTARTTAGADRPAGWSSSMTESSWSPRVGTSTTSRASASRTWRSSWSATTARGCG